MRNAAAQQDLPSVRDFPDQLPPMVVKELRQGLKRRLMGEAVSGFHLILVALLFPALTFGHPSEVAGVRNLLWLVGTGLLVLLLPLRLLSALIQEKRENTLDTLLLTRLTAGRIVWGKWQAGVLDILVAAALLVPYTLTVYAAGGMPLMETLMTLLRLTLVGVTLSAFYVALSWNQSWLWRMGPALVLSVWTLTKHVNPMVKHLLYGTGPGAASTVGGILLEMAAAASLVYVALEVAASRLASVVEDHTTRPRLVALALPLLLLLFGRSLPDIDSGKAVTVSLAATLMLTPTALTDPWPAPASTRWRGWPFGIAWALAAWALLVWVGASAATGRWATTIPALFFWLFAGRLILFVLPVRAACSPAALLVSSALLIAGGAVLGLVCDLLHLHSAAVLLSLLHVPFVSGTGTAGMPLLVAFLPAALCGGIALMAWLRHRPRRKEALAV